MGTTRQNELATCITVYGLYCGISFTKLINFFGGMSTPPPMHLKVYERTVEKVQASQAHNVYIDQPSQER